MSNERQFKFGDRVEHSIYGEGLVVDVRADDWYGFHGKDGAKVNAHAKELSPLPVEALSVEPPEFEVFRDLLGSEGALTDACVSVLRLGGWRGSVRPEVDMDAVNKRLTDFMARPIKPEVEKPDLVDADLLKAFEDVTPVEIKVGSRWTAGGSFATVTDIEGDNVRYQWDGEDRKRVALRENWTAVFTPISDTPKIEVGSKWTDASGRVAEVFSRDEFHASIRFVESEDVRTYRHASFLETFTPIPEDSSAPEGVGEGWVELGDEEYPDGREGDEVQNYAGSMWSGISEYKFPRTVAEVRASCPEMPRLRYRRPISKPSVVSEPTYLIDMYHDAMGALAYIRYRYGTLEGVEWDRLGIATKSSEVTNHE